LADYRLIVQTPGGQAHDFPLAQGSVAVGRSPECDVILDSRYVSRLHATILLDQDGLRVIDAGSTNGVLVNGSRIDGERALSEGDRIQIADVILEVAGPAAGETTITPLLPHQGDRFRCDSATWEVWLDGAKVDVKLSVQEFALLRALADEPGRVRTHKELGDTIWGADKYDGNMIHQLAYRLREKLGPEHQGLVQSLPGVGYRIAPEPPS
jgi:hypothetical protein